MNYLITEAYKMAQSRIKRFRAETCQLQQIGYNEAFNDLNVQIGTH